MDWRCDPRGGVGGTSSGGWGNTGCGRSSDSSGHTTGCGRSSDSGGHTIGCGRSFGGGGHTAGCGHGAGCRQRLGSGRGPGGCGYNAHRGDRPRSNIRKIATAQPAGEPGAPAAFESGPLSETRDVLDTGKGTTAGSAGRGGFELALDEAA